MNVRDCDTVVAVHGPPSAVVDYFSNNTEIRITIPACPPPRARITRHAEKRLKGLAVCMRAGVYPEGGHGAAGAGVKRGQDA